MSVPARTSFRNILVPTDFSPSSETVLPYAASLARKTGAKLFISHVLSVEVVSVDPPLTLEFREVAERQMQDLMMSEQLEGIPCQALLGEGKTTDVLAEMVKANDIDLIVLATHGRTGFRKFVMGSIAEDIFRHASCPVMTLGPRVNADARRDATFTHILYATDLAPGAAAGFSHVRSIIDPASSLLTLIHVMPSAPRADPEAVAAELRRKLQDMVPRDLDMSAPPEAVVEVGEPAEWIVRNAAGRHTDLIILGCRRAAPLSSHFMDTAYKVIVEAPCPVLTVSAAHTAAAA